MANARENPLGRRRFLKGAAASAATLVAKSAPISAQPQEAGKPRTCPTAPPNAQLAADTEPPPRRAASRIVERPGSDFMVDVIKNLGFEYVAANPGSSFEGLHESIINYGSNTMPELLTNCHEESSVAMAHGYAKIEGKPMLAIVHGNIGLQHASMAIYNAYADRVPVFVIAGNWRDAGTRNNGVNSYHSAQDMALLVQLAELLQAPVNGGGDRVNFPSRHPLAGAGSGAADVILNLEVQGGGGPGFVATTPAANAKTINISSLGLYIKSNLQDFQ